MREFYAGDLPTTASALLNEAMCAYADTEQAEILLRRAQNEAPDALPVYFSLYKFYFSKGRLEHATRQALETAARLPGWPVFATITVCLRQTRPTGAATTAPSTFISFR